MTEKKKIFLTALITAITTAIVTCGITLVVKDIASVMIFGNSEQVFLKKIKAVDTVLGKKYLYDYDKDELREKAVKAYVDGLEEPYTHYYSSAEFSSYIDNIQD